MHFVIYHFTGCRLFICNVIIVLKHIVCGHSKPHVSKYAKTIFSCVAATSRRGMYMYHASFNVYAMWFVLIVCAMWDAYICAMCMHV